MRMSDNTYNVVELVGTSEESITKAIDVAIAKASQSIRRLGWFQVIQVRGSVEDGKASRYQVTLKAGFTLES
jgi:dodecin